MRKTIKQYTSHVHLIQRYSTKRFGRSCQHRDSNPQTSDQVVHHQSHTSLTGLGPIWLARMGPNW